MIEFTENDLIIRSVNRELLTQQLTAASLPNFVSCLVKRVEGVIRLRFDTDESQRAAILVVLNAHDSTQLTDEQAFNQAAFANTADARELLADVGGDLRDLPFKDAAYALLARVLAIANGADETAWRLIIDKTSAQTYVTTLPKWQAMSAEERAWWALYLEATSYLFITAFLV